MVRYKYSDSVTIQISGPKTVLPDPLTALGRLGMTWLHFLNTTCGLQLDNDGDYYICTSTYCATDPESGWTASLNDQIKSFIDKYSRKRAKYCVRLHTGSEPGSNTSSTSVSVSQAITTTTTTYSTHTWTPSILRKRTANVTSPAKKFAAVVPLTPSQMSQQFRKPVLGEVYVRPTPAIVIPIRGTQVITPIQHPSQRIAHNQVITPIQPVIPPQKSSNKQTSTAASSKSKTAQSISEVSIRMGKGSHGRTESDTSNGNREPRPPKLTRFDQSEQQRNKYAVDEPQPSTSAAAAAATANVPASPRNGRPKRRPTRFEEDSFPIDLAGCKIEPIEIELDEVPETIENLRQPNQHFLDALGIEDDEEGQEPYVNDDNDDNLSMCTAVSVEEQDLVQAGIPIRDIKSLIDRRLERFDTSMLQRIQNEIKGAKQKGKWDRNVKRSPLCCYLLSEIFKEPL